MERKRISKEDGCDIILAGSQKCGSNTFFWCLSRIEFIESAK